MGAFRWLYPWVLWGIPIVWLLVGFHGRLLLRRQGLPVARAGENGANKKTSRGLRLRVLALTPHVLRGSVLTLLICAAARPYIDLGNERRQNAALDMMLAIDTSGSMQALDFTQMGQRINRLSVVKSVVADFMRDRVGDRLGLLVFGSEAYMQVPLTLDHGLLEQALSRIKIGMAGDGTAIGDGLGLAARRMDGVEAKSKIVILLTDGANTSGILDPKAATDAAKALGIKVYTILVGSDGPVPFPDGRGFVQYVEMHTDPQLLTYIADTTGGKFFRASDTDALKEIYKTIDKLETTEREAVIFARRQDEFAWFVILALILLGVELAWRVTRWQVLA